MMNQSGVYEGVAWSVVHKGGKLFELTVGDKVEEYTCMYAPIFGLDISDQNAINRLLDKMQGLTKQKGSRANGIVHSD